jgi:hypothetical protein
MILDGAANQRSGTWIQHLAKSRHSSLTPNPRCNNTPITVGNRLVAGSLCSGRLQKLPKGGGIWPRTTFVPAADCQIRELRPVRRVAKKIPPHLKFSGRGNGFK